MQEYINLISNVGFPIAITIYLLVTQSKVIKENTKAINELNLLIKEKF